MRDLVRERPCGLMHACLLHGHSLVAVWILYYDTANRSRVRACMALLRKDKVKSVIIIARAQKSNVPVFNLHPQAAVLERGCSCH